MGKTCISLRCEAARLASRVVAGMAIATLACASVASAAVICVNPAGKFGCKSTISAAVSAASPGDTILVGQGTYDEQVTISKSLSLVAAPLAQPTINAMNKPVGIFVDGMASAPGIGVANVVIAGFAVRNANFEGILIANADNITVTNNHVSHNNQSLDASGGTCPGIPAFETNEDFDCGEGIHLMGVRYSSLIQNEVDHNSGGILISDETGATHDNLISGNNVHDNPWDCGITLASHGPATTVVPTATHPFGITHNTITHNISAHNGMGIAGAGAGVGIFAPFPGTTNSGNVVIGNELLNNGLPGVTMHNHAWAPSPAPGVNLNNNSIINNHISGNAKDTDDAATSGPTGINLFSRAPVAGTVISGNTFDRESIDIAFKVPAGQLDAHFNNFSAGTGIDNLGTGKVDATENWWHCPFGPLGGKCAAVAGSNVSVTPWLLFPFTEQ